MDSEILEKQLEKLKVRVRYDKDIFGDEENYLAILNDLLEDSWSIAMSILYPFDDFSMYELPKRYYNWQIRACVQLYRLAGKENIASYHENGLSWTMFKSGLSIDLLNELMPKVGVPKRDLESESDTNV